MEPLARELIRRIEDLYEVSFRRSDYKFHISGNDSDLSRGLGRRFDNVFPSNLLNVSPDRQSLLDNTDICLIISDPYDAGSSVVGIFGEVEGHHGEYISRASYWARKNNRYVVFAIGVVPEAGKGVYIETREFDGVDRVLVTFEAEHFIVKDFRLALHWIEQLFHNGPGYRCEINDDDLKFFVDLVKKNWHVPTSELLRVLQLYTSSKDLVEVEPGLSSVIPGIQA